MMQVWLFQLAENLEIDDGARVMRTGLISQEFERAGCKIYFFSGLFQHGKKKFRPYSPGLIRLREQFNICLLRCLSFKNNLSLKRVLSQCLSAIDFLWRSRSLPKPNLLFISYPSPELAAAAALYARTLKIPYVVDVRDAWPTIFRGYGSKTRRAAMLILGVWYGYLYKYLLSSATLIIGTSRQMLNDAKKYSKHMSAGRVVYLSYPPPAINLKPIPKEFTEESPLLVSFVCTFGISYDVPLLINAARRLFPKMGTKIQFNIIGDGTFRQEWETSAIDIPTVHFTGWLNQTELNLVMSSSHVGALLCIMGTSDYTIPNKLGEYLAFGLAIANSVLGDVPEIIQTNGVGINVGGEDQEEAICTWLESLVSNPEQIMSYRQRSLELFERSFNAAKVYPAICADLLNSASGT